MDYWVYTAAGFMLTVGSLLVLAHVVRQLVQANSQLQKKLMAMTAQYPHQAYLELQGKNLELQRMQWEAAAKHASSGTTPVHAVTQPWETQEAGS